MPFTLTSGVETVLRPVSELQRGYKAVLEEVSTGHDVVLTRNSEEVAALVGIDRYMETQRKAALAEELELKLELLQAKLELALAGGPSLVEARQIAQETKSRTPEEQKAFLKARRRKE